MTESTSTPIPESEDSRNLTLAALDRRLSEFIAREEKRKHWKDVVIPIVSALVALAGISTGAVLQFTAFRSQERLKQYEVTFLAKQKAYAQVMASVHALFLASATGSNDGTIRGVTALEADVFAVQPFLEVADQDGLWMDVQQFIALCWDSSRTRQSNDDKHLKEIAKSFTNQRDKIRQRLTQSLFRQQP
jgi:hypothetical protein